VETVGGATSHQFWDDDTQHKFDVTILLDKPDPRLRPGFAVQLSIRGDELSNAVSIPSEAVFDREGKKIVYCKQHGSFEPQQVKIRALSEGRAVLEGIRPGTVVALVNPETRASEKAKAGNAGPAPGPSVK
jgi:multidrug efflux pump subunit AcrA (membrane-fusion protein)